MKMGVLFLYLGLKTKKMVKSYDPTISSLIVTCDVAVERRPVARRCYDFRLLELRLEDRLGDVIRNEHHRHPERAAVAVAFEATFQPK